MGRVQRPAKFTMPQQRGVVARERLFAQLDGAADQTAVWISGVPGAGKTTLAASYIRARQLPCIWIRLDSADDDCAELFRSFTQAAGAEGAQRKPLPLYAPEHAPNLQHFARRYFRALFERLQPCRLVLDNVHALEGSAPLDVLRIALDETPEDVRWLLVSRAEPPAEFTVLEAGGALARLNNDALRFSLDEMRSMLPAAPAANLAAIHEMTQGWTAGIVLAANYDSARQDPAQERQRDSREAIFRFFGQELLRAMPPNEQRFLQIAALLPEMSVARVAALTGEGNAQAILESLYRRGLFTSYRRGDPDTYQFHDLVRAFLRREAQQRIPVAELAAARRHAAQLLGDAGDFISAYALLIESHEWELAARLIVDAAPQLLHQGRYATLRRWIEELPPSAVEHNGWLLYWMGQACVRDLELVAVSWFEKAYQAFRTAGDLRGQLLSSTSAIDAISAAEADFQLFPVWAERLKQLLGNVDEPPAPADQLQLTLALIQAAVMGFPVLLPAQTVAMIDQWLESLEANSQLLDRSALVAGGTTLMFFHAWTRNEQLFQRTRRLVEPVLNEPSVNPMVKGKWLARTGCCHVLFNVGTGTPEHLKLARGAFREVRDIAEREQILLLKFIALQNEAWMAQFMRDEVRFAALVSEMEPLIIYSRPVLVQEYYSYVCRMHLVQGKFEAALIAAERGLAGARKANCSANLKLALTSYHCCSLIALQREMEAVEILREQIEDLVDRPRTLAQILLQFTHALHARRCGQDYLQPLREGLRMARECGWTLILEAVPSLASPLFNDALQNDIETDFVRSCIAKQALPPPAGAGEEWPWPIRLRLLGPFELHLGDAPAEFGAKMPRQVIRLLQAVAIAGIDGLDAEQAADCLWPEGDPSGKLMTTAVYRLRKILGEGSSILVRDGRLLLDRQRVWTDLQEFESLSEGILSADLSSYSSDLLDVQAARLFKLCRGPLPAEDSAKALLLGARERYREKFERVVHVLGRQLEQRDRRQAALELYGKAIEHDNLAEEMYRGQIRCHLAMEQPAEALRAYRRCRDVLSIVLSVAPAPQTTALLLHCGEQL